MNKSTTWTCASCCTPPICICDSPSGSGPPGTLPRSFCLTWTSTDCPGLNNFTIRFSTQGSNTYWTYDYPMTDPIPGSTGVTLGTLPTPMLFAPGFVYCTNHDFGAGSVLAYFVGMPSWLWYIDAVAGCTKYSTTSPGFFAKAADVNCAGGTISFEGASMTFNSTVLCPGLPCSNCFDGSIPVTSTNALMPSTYTTLPNCSGANPAIFSLSMSLTGCGCFDSTQIESASNLPDPSTVTTITATVTIGGTPVTIAMYNAATNGLTYNGGCLWYRKMTVGSCNVQIGIVRANYPFNNPITYFPASYYYGSGFEPGQYAFVYYCGTANLDGSSCGGTDCWLASKGTYCPIIIDTCSPFTAHATSCPATGNTPSGGFFDSLCESAACANGLFSSVTFSQ